MWLALLFFGFFGRWHSVRAARLPGRCRAVPRDQARSKRSAFITLFQAATKSRTNFCCESSCA